MGLQKRIEEAIIKNFGSVGTCSTQELHKFLETRFELSYSQSSGRIRQLVQSGIIENTERGKYRVDIIKSKKLVLLFRTIQKVISDFNPPLSECIAYDSRDKEALKELESIKDIVKIVLEMYRVGDSY